MSTKRIDGKRGTDAVLALLRRESTAVQIARQHGMSEQSLYRLRDEFLAAGRAALNSRGRDGSARGEVQQLRREIAERDRVIGEITIANRILKKTADGLL
jgi:transposase-like protein